MGAFMKTLISLTCLMVMAAAGWYLYSERQAYLARDQIRGEMERIAAQPGPSDCSRAARDALANTGMADMETLNFCDSRGMMDADTRQKLDFAGVF
jgi:hypothetical protein